MTFIRACRSEKRVYMCVCVIFRKFVRRGEARGAGRRRPCGVCAAAVGSCRRQSPGPGACCTPRPPPRSPRRRRPAPPGWPAWSSAPRRSSSATWCVGSETTPEHTTAGLSEAAACDSLWSEPMRLIMHLVCKAMLHKVVKITHNPTLHAGE